MIYYKKDFLSISDFSKNNLDYLFNIAKRIKNGEKFYCDNLLVGNFFLEPSTRTRLSFEAAASLMGGKYIELCDIQISSFQKGESFEDTIRMIDGYTDVIVIRHSISGIASYAAEIAKHPVINAGDGENQHPTQTLQDIFTLKEEFGEINSLSIAIVGDLKHSRVVNSLVRALILYNVKKIYFVSPKGLECKSNLKVLLDKANIAYDEVLDVSEIINDIDVLYITRLQKERFDNIEKYEEYKNSYFVNLKILQNSVNNKIKVMHPFPRNEELNVDVDSSPYNLYIKQAHNGIYTRQALLGLVTGVIPEEYSEC